MWMEMITSSGGMASTPSSNHRSVPASRIAASVASRSVIFLRIHDTHRISFKLALVRVMAGSTTTGRGSTLPRTGRAVSTSSNTTGGEGEGNRRQIHRFNAQVIRETVDLEEEMMASRRCLVAFHKPRRALDAGVWNGHSYEDVPATTIPR